MRTAATSSSPRRWVPVFATRPAFGFAKKARPCSKQAPSALGQFSKQDTAIGHGASFPRSSCPFWQPAIVARDTMAFPTYNANQGFWMRRRCQCSPCSLSLQHWHRVCTAGLTPPQPLQRNSCMLHGLKPRRHTLFAGMWPWPLARLKGGGGEPCPLFVNQCFMAHLNSVGPDVRLAHG